MNSCDPSTWSCALAMAGGLRASLTRCLGRGGCGGTSLFSEQNSLDCGPAPSSCTPVKLRGVVHRPQQHQPFTLQTRHYGNAHSTSHQRHNLGWEHGQIKWPQSLQSDRETSLQSSAESHTKHEALPHLHWPSPSDVPPSSCQILGLASMMAGEYTSRCGGAPPHRRLATAGHGREPRRLTRMPWHR